MKLERIDNIAKVGAGQGAPQQENDFSNVGIPFIRAGSLEDLLSGRDELTLPRINEEIAKKYKLKLYKSDTIVFAKSGMSATKERIYKLINPCYIVNHLAVLELNSDVSPDFIFYVLKAFPPAQLIKDPAYPSISLADISQFKIPFPPLFDQIRIAEILSQAEALITQRKQSISLLDELLKSTFLEMFGGMINSEKNQKSIGELIKRKIILDIQDGNHGEKHPKREHFIENGIPFIMANCFVDNKLDIEKAYKLDPRWLNDLRIGFSKIGDVLLTHKGSIGFVTINEGEYETIILSPQVTYYRIDINIISNKFLKYMFLSEFFQRQLKKESKQATRDYIGITRQQKLKIVIPAFALQTQFAIIVEKVETLKSQYQQSLTELQNMYGVLSQKAFKGELSINKHSKI